MKIRVSHILKAVALLLLVGSVFALFIKQPIKPINFKQKELYSSSLYQFLAKSGKERKGWVSFIKGNKDETHDISVRFFNDQGQTVEAYIPMIKVQYNEGDFVDILYNPNNTREARLAPSMEASLNWSLFGWCFSIGIALYWLGSFRQKVSGGIE